jgi:hypothetical protein
VTPAHKRCRRGNHLLGFLMDGVLAKDGIVLLQLKAVRRVTTVFHRRVTGRSGSFRAIQDDLQADVFGLCHWVLPCAQTATPLARASRSTAEIPFLLMDFRVFVETFNVTQRFSSGMKKRFFCTFTSKRRFALLFAWETWFPATGPLPVSSSFLAMGPGEWRSLGSGTVVGSLLSRPVPPGKTRFATHNRHRTENIRSSGKSSQGYPQRKDPGFLPVFGEGGSRDPRFFGRTHSRTAQPSARNAVAGSMAAARCAGYQAARIHSPMARETTSVTSVQRMETG